MKKINIKKIQTLIQKYLNFNHIKTSILIFWFSLLKQNTRYPSYLLNFEKNISNYFNSNYAISFSNGTTACTALLYAVGVKKNSKVLVSKLTFPSVISSILRIGGIPVYLDFDENLQIDTNKIDINKILEASFLLITHVYGFPQKFETIKKILNMNKSLILIEDISHAQGAKCNDMIVGTIGQGSFMSMQGDKAINAGEGGIVFTNHQKIYKKLFYQNHLNRKTLEKDINDYDKLIAKLGLLGKGRMAPLGALTAQNDLKNLAKRNLFFRRKIEILYKVLKNFKEVHVPNIENINCLGGFHYGIPFICKSQTLINSLKKKFNILEYDWPILDNCRFFSNPDLFLDYLYKQDRDILKVFDKSNDLRDELYFFELNQFYNINIKEITNRLDHCI